MWKTIIGLIAGAIAIAVIVVISRDQSSTELAGNAGPTCSEAAKQVVNFDPVAPPKPFTQGQFLADGQTPRTIAYYRGQGVVLNFWATWCAPCVREMPSLLRLKAKIAEQGIQVVPLSEDLKGAPVVRKFYAQHKLAGFEILLDKGGEILRASNIRGLPTTLLIDRAGKEVGRVTGPLEWDQPKAVALVRACLGKAAGS